MILNSLVVIRVNMWQLQNEAVKNGSLGVMNNSIGKTVDVNLDFLPAGNFAIEMWADTKKSDKEPMELKKSEKTS